MTSPTSVPAHLLAADEPTGPASSGSSGSSEDGALRSAIVSVARHYLQLARTRTPAEMESLIWQASSVDGADHGQSCAAFASLTLALGAKAAGQQSWVTGGGSYPWPLRQWPDVRVQPNPASPDVVSMLQDAQAHDRWYPLGDGYRPRPGDWKPMRRFAACAVRSPTSSAKSMAASPPGKPSRSRAIPSAPRPLITSR